MVTRKILFIAIVYFVIIIIITSSCSNDTPNVDITANLINLSDEEFSYVGTKGINMNMNIILEKS